MVVVSAGFHKTHVTTAAREISDRGLLSLAIVAAYPTQRLERILRRLGLADKGRIARLLERGEEIPESRLRALFVPELLDELPRFLARIPSLRRLSGRLSVACFRLYGRRASRQLGDAEEAGVFLFRAGFGGASIDRARELGMVVLCDHAIAHPSLLAELVDNRGQLREAVLGEPSEVTPAPPDDSFWRAILADIDRSDAVLVNSEFVKQTMLTAGWPEDRVHVVYLGVDDNFLDGARIEARRAPRGRLSLLFAGRLEQRKGADVLIEALREVGAEVDWELIVAGPVTAEIRSRHEPFLEDERVRLLGTLRRPELREQMLSAPVFVFPSYAEGSARAAFEALACGCYVITTPNSGTIVEDGVHGALVPAGDAVAFAAAIVDADRNRARIAEIGNRNAAVVAHEYRQADYGDGLAAVAEKLVGRPAQRLA